MVEFTIYLKSSAQKELDAFSQSLFERINSKILALAHNPRPPGCKKLKDQDSLWRIRVGDYRIVYAIEDTSLSIKILRIRHRKEVYDN